MRMSLDRLVSAEDMRRVAERSYIVYRRRDATTVRRFIAHITSDLGLQMKWGYHDDAPDFDGMERQIVKCKDCNYCHQIIDCKTSKPRTVGRWCSMMGMSVSPSGTCHRASDKWGPTIHLDGGCLGSLNGISREELVNRLMNIAEDEDDQVDNNRRPNVDNSGSCKQAQDVVSGSTSEPAASCGKSK